MVNTDFFGVVSYSHQQRTEVNIMGYYIGAYFFMVAIFCGLVSTSAFYLFAGIGALFFALQWVIL